MTCIATFFFTSYAHRLEWFHSRSTAAAFRVAAKAASITFIGHLAACAAEAHTLRHISAAWRRFDAATAAATLRLRRAAILASRNTSLSAASALVSDGSSGSGTLRTALSTALAAGLRAAITTERALAGLGCGVAAPAKADKEAMALDARTSRSLCSVDDQCRSGCTGVCDLRMRGTPAKSIAMVVEKCRPSARIGKLRRNPRSRMQPPAARRRRLHLSDRLPVCICIRIRCGCLPAVPVSFSLTARELLVHKRRLLARESDRENRDDCATTSPSSSPLPHPAAAA